MCVTEIDFMVIQMNFIGEWKLDSCHWRQVYEYGVYLPIQEERLLERSMRARFPGLLRRERLASEMSAVTRVIVILKQTCLHNFNFIHAIDMFTLIPYY